jgi:4-hydroxybutyrate CoA-transferase
MVSINSAIGIDLHGNIWAASLAARRIYSGVGGAADFARRVTYRSNRGNWSIIAMKSTSSNGRSKVYDMRPKGITTTAIPSDQVVLVTEHGALDPRGLSIGERAVGTAYLAGSEQREVLLRGICDSGVFHKPKSALRNGYPKGFTSAG